jgi:predicted Co/Zn/Cd cation transporter (cation efflux family)
VAVAVLLALPIMGLVRGVGPWMPSELVGALDSLLRGGSLADFTRAVLVTLAAIPAALAWAFRRLERREL